MKTRIREFPLMRLNVLLVFMIGFTFPAFAARVATPTFSPGSGTYSSAQSVSILCSTPSVTIRYTTDGSTPSSSKGTIYTGPITVSATMTIKAMAYRSNYSNSYVGTASYVINLPPVGSPVFDPPAAQYDSPQSVVITTSTDGATIRYTLNGSTPSSTSGTVYSEPVEIEQNKTLKAIAYKTGSTNSAVVSGLYTIEVSVPAFSPEPGSYEVARDISLSSATGGAIIKYTIDGSMPSQAYGTVYVSPFTLSTNTTVKAMAYKTGMIDSDVVSGVFSFACATPVFDPVPGAYPSTQNVTLSTTTSGASIRYTLDGTEPGTTSGTLYQGAIEISQNTTVRAIALKSGQTASQLSDGSYIIQCDAPVFSPVAGAYPNVQEISITSTTPSVEIRYTTDGTDPSSTSGTLVSGTVLLNVTGTLKAVAYKPGMGDSPAATAAYTLTCATPVFLPAPGNYERPQQVAITSATAGAVIRYTTNGEDPTQESGTVYSVAVAVNADATIKAIAFRPGFSDSGIFTGSYVIGLPDTDGDGVVDMEDDYPGDPLRALNNLFPAAGPGTLAFEDLWPAQGDYDMNDLVVDYQFKTVTNATNHLVETVATFTLRAAGATLKNGFGFQLASEAIPATALKVTGYQLTNAYITINDSGTEANQKIPTIIVFDNVFDILKSPGSGSGVNTDPEATFVEPVVITVTINYTQDSYTEDQLNIEKFNPFLIVNMQRGREVHLIDFLPTTLADLKLLGTSGDYSNPSDNKYYRTVNNLPWALNIPESFAYPKEKSLLLNAYTHFAEWAQSSGTLYPDWYQDKAGYRNSEVLYIKN